MSAEYRLLKDEDLERAAHVEARPFYGRSTPERVETMRKFIPPEWAVGAFVEGQLVADVRTVPQVRRMSGSKTGFGAVGPVACLAPYRRQGHVGKLLKLALETMRDRAQLISGLHTPHDALYRRYGWERAEGKKRYEIEPKRAQLRFRGARGTTSPVLNDGWERLDAIFREGTRNGNGAFVRAEVWWREVLLREYGNDGKTVDSDAVVWTDGSGKDQGYVVYFERPTGERKSGWERQEIFVRDFVALTADAYLGLWEHLFSHDLAATIVIETRRDDPLPDLLEDPFVVQQTIPEGAMLRIVDVERALGKRPYLGGENATATLRIEDATLPENTGTWRITGSGREMSAERNEAGPDVEMSVNALAPLYSGYTSPVTAAACGLITLNNPEALPALSRLFAVDDIPYSPDWY